MTDNIYHLSLLNMQMASFSVNICLYKVNSSSRLCPYRRKGRLFDVGVARFLRNLRADEPRRVDCGGVTLTVFCAHGDTLANDSLLIWQFIILN